MLRLLPWLLLSACSVSRAVAPLPAGSGAVTTSLGGPITADLGTAIPLPLLSVGYMHGLDGRTNLHGAVYPIGLPTFGVGGLDLGVAREVFPPAGARPRLMVDGTVYAYAGDTEPGDPPFGARVFPDVSAVASWDVGRHAVYVGVDQLVEPFPSFRWHVTPLVGGIARAGRVGLQLEYQWLALYRDNDPIAAQWIGPGGQGASSVLLGVSVAVGPQEAP